MPAHQLFNSECSTPFSEATDTHTPSPFSANAKGSHEASESALTDKGLTVTVTLAAFLDQGLPVWNPKLSLDEVKPEGTRKEKEEELRDQLQKETFQLQVKEKEVRRGPQSVRLIQTVSAHPDCEGSLRLVWGGSGAENPSRGNGKQEFPSLNCYWMTTSVHFLL